MIKKIIIGVLALLILTITLFLAIEYDVFTSNESKLKKEDSTITAIEIFNEKFLDTKKENVGRKILLDKLTNNFILDSDRNYALLSDYMEGDGGLNIIIMLLEDFNNKDSSDNIQEVLEFFVDFKKLADKTTPLKYIYANPSDYYGKEVIIYGVIGDNDVKRKMLSVGTYYTSYATDSYPLEIQYSNMENEKEWLDSDFGYIIAKGSLKKYSNSNDAYLVPKKLEYIDNVDITSWYVESADTQIGESIVNKETILTLADSIMDNLELMEEFTSEIIKRWNNAISSNKDFNSEVEKLYKEKSAELMVITLNYTNHIFTFADMKNVPTEINPAFEQLKTLENLYADFYKSKIEDPKGSLLTYSNGVTSSLEEIKSSYRKLLNSF